ncbi:MAG TPA: 2,3-bisphosphoglycerate-dependent phosphoglycerate mutase [Candidatus Paceibacterota bacterium]
MGHLILVRHAKSEWNALGKWTGWQDVSLSEEGRAQAAETAEQLRGLAIDRAYTADLKRCSETLDIILDRLGARGIPIIVEPAIKERDYGIFTGKNKWQIKEQVGEEKFQRIRRGWDEAIPEGETLKDVHARVVPYVTEHILPDVTDGKRILIVSSGNALRAIVKYLENISDEAIADLEIGVGEAYVYELDGHGKILSKHIRAEKVDKGKI